MNDKHCHEMLLNELDRSGAFCREAALTAEREYRLVAQRLRAEANRFEIVKERFAIAEILELRSLAKLESYRKQHGVVAVP